MCHWLNVELVIERKVDFLQREMKDRGKCFRQGEQGKARLI